MRRGVKYWAQLADTIPMRVLLITTFFSLFYISGSAWASCEDLRNRCDFGSMAQGIDKCSLTYEEKVELRRCNGESTASAAAKTAREECQRAAKEEAQRKGSGGDGRTPADETQARVFMGGQELFEGDNSLPGPGEKYTCQCPGQEEKREINDDLSCDPNKKSESKSGDGESPFNCAGGGGGGGDGGQAAQQHLQQRAQLENQCNQNYEKARVDCDPDSVVGFSGAFEEAMAKAEKARAAGEQSAKQACDEYTKAFEKAANELKTFRSTCSSSKASCLSGCNSSMVKNGQTSPIMAALASCLPMLGAIAQSMAAANTSIEQVQIKDCSGFESVLADADAKQRELVDTMRMADKCQSELQESCAANPSAEHCRRLDTANNDQGSQISEVDTELSASPNLDGIDDGPGLAGAPAAIDPVEAAEGGSRVNTPTGNGSANLGSAGSGGAGPNGASGSPGGYYSQYDDLYGRLKGDQFDRPRRGGRGGGSGSRYKPRRPSGRKGRLSKKGKGGLDLKKFLPGGKGAKGGLVDGITPASGPSIFEKVSNRYKLKKNSLIRR